MTKSSRRMDAIAGRSKWSTTDKKCEECNGELVKLGANVYVCSKCGLKQRVDPIRKLYKRNSLPKYSEQMKESLNKSTLTPTIYDKAKFSKFNQTTIFPFKCSKCNRRFKTHYYLDQHFKKQHYKPKLVDKKNIIFCDKCNNLMSGSHKKGKLICVACVFIKQIP